MDASNRDNSVQQINQAIEESEQGLERYYLALKEKNKKDPNPDREEVLKDYKEYYRTILDCKRGQESIIESIVEHMVDKEGDSSNSNRNEDARELQRLKKQLETVRSRIRSVTDLIY